MNELMTLSFDIDDQFPVSGRELHAKLEISTRYNDWFPRMSEYGFDEGTDYCSFLSNGDGFGKAATRTDHRLTLSMAKELAMLQRTDAGRAIRRYLIAVEEQWNQPEAVMSRALKMAQKTIDGLAGRVQSLELTVTAQAPKVRFADAVDAGKTSFRDMRMCHKDYERISLAMARVRSLSRIVYECAEHGDCDMHLAETLRLVCDLIDAVENDFDDSLEYVKSEAAS